MLVNITLTQGTIRLGLARWAPVAAALAKPHQKFPRPYDLSARALKEPHAPLLCQLLQVRAVRDLFRFLLRAVDGGSWTLCPRRFNS